VSSFRRPGVLARRYPAIAIAFAATAVTIAPLTAAAATGSHTSTSTSATASTAAKTAAKTAAVAKASAEHAAAAKKSAAAEKGSATASTAKSAAKPVVAQSTAKTQAAAPASAAATVVSTSPYAGVSYASLEPTGTDGSQQTFSASSDQWANATAIVEAAKDLNLSAYAAVIGVATAMQESSLHNLTVATNADSLGLFQQRPSMGWGTPSELTDPTYAAKAFLRELPSDYENMDLADAAQSVQRSFDGSLYSQWESQAAHMVYSIAHS
jgi:hypothetical protein